MPVSVVKTFLNQCIRLLQQYIGLGFEPRSFYPSSRFLKRKVRVDIYYPNSRLSSTEHLFCFLDGQDVRSMDIPAMQAQLIKEGYPPFLLIGIHANEDRMQEYGTLSQADYAGRGAKAPETARFITEELFPYLQNKGLLKGAAKNVYIGGFSLSGLLAFDLAWHFPQQFSGAGVFSGALWWRSKRYDKKKPDANRILHQQVEASTHLPAVRFWFQAGTEDEKSDRNKNGIIDAIDDTLDLMRLLREKGQPEENLSYLEVEGGRHEPGTWADAMPHFIRWALD